MVAAKNYFGKGNIRPNLPGVKPAINPADPVEKAKNSLRSAESAAQSDENSRTDDDDQNLATIEESPRSLYVGSGRSDKSRSSRSRNNRIGKNPKSSQVLKKFLLRSSPFLFIVVLLIVVVVAVIGSSSFLGPHISALFTESTNIDYTAYNLRANELFIEILDGKMEMTDYLKTRLEKQGFTVNPDQTLVFQGTTVTADNYMSLYNGNVEFREAIIDARHGRGATFFDETAKSFYKKLGLSRDVLHSYETSDDEATDKASYDELMTKYFDVSASSNINTAYRETTTDENGNQTSEIVETGATVSSGAKLSSTENATANSAKERAREYLDSVGDKVEADTPGCAALEIGNMVATAVASNAKYTYANTYMTTMESISKAMAGDGNNSAINTVLNWLTTTATAKVYDSVTGEELEVTGAPIEAQSMRMVLNDLPANQSETRKYSLERSFDSTDISIKNAGLATTMCNVERAAGVVLSLNALAVPGSALVRTTIGLLLNVTVGQGVKIVASSVLSLLIPTIAEIMYENSYTQAVGIAGGEEFGMGAANVNQLAGQQNSGATGASKSAVLAYNHANNLTIAQEAEIDRKKYSPFDASNKNTFVGSITRSLLPLAATTSAMTPISTLTSVSSSALASLNPTYADGENTSYLTNFGSYCDKVEAIGAVGNVYCNMVAINDLSTLDLSENDAKYQAVISESIEIIDGKEVVKDGSPLADFITYWMGRYSMPGIYDANIAHACEEQISGRIPIISNIVLMVKSIDSDYCKTVADGSRYVNSEDNPYWEIEKYHQLWALSTRVKENFGYYQDSKNPLTAYREHYESLHPLDNSRAGYLARISGLTKDDAETVIALVDYYHEIENYHPETAYQFVTQETFAPQVLEENSPVTIVANVVESYAVEKRREGTPA